MNFLEICKRVIDEADRDSDLLTTVSLSLLEEPQHRKVVNWVKKAYSSLQNEQRYWRFHHRSGEMFSLPSGVKTAEVAGVKNVLKDSFIGRNAVGNSWCLTYLDYQDFRQANKLRLTTVGTPIWITRLPSEEFEVFPTPNAAITVFGDWFSANDVMEVNSDEPVWDEDFHEILVWMALRDYATAYDVPELLPRVDTTLPQMTRQFRNRYLDDVELRY